MTAETVPIRRAPMPVVAAAAHYMLAMRRRQRQIGIDQARAWLDSLDARIAAVDDTNDRRVAYVAELGRAEHHVAQLLDVIADLQQEQSQ